LIALLSITFLLTASGCGDSAALRKEISGTWTRTVLGERGGFTGTLTLTPEGAFAFSPKGNVTGHDKSQGSYRLSGRDIKFEDNSCNGTGTYRFLLKNGTLSFLPLSDGCVKRKVVLTGEWKRE
jgi:hypothetical protein